jgi:NAD(P)-dependent dehydrogenase (short-subunit alcohol dehydrogenase family)/rhamnose utilization protein RhaD (predicted bifunctional aldolase and dehydrogenase)
MSLKTLTKLSRKFGSDSRYVLAGGGNTSYKTLEFLYVKPSGVTLKDISEDDFVKMDRAKIREVFELKQSGNSDIREDAVKRIMAYAVLPGSSGRPSVEAPLHDLIPYKYVVHLHPAKVNGMTCGKNGRAVCAELFPDSLWIEYVDPGFILAAEVKNAIAEFAKSRNFSPKVIFLKNHGVFAGGDSEEEIISLYAGIMEKLDAFYAEAGVSTELEKGDIDRSAVLAAAPKMRSLLADPKRKAIVSIAPFAVAAGPLSPDHIVYAGSFALECASCEDIEGAIAKFAKAKGRNPLVISIPGKAVFCAGDSLKSAGIVSELAMDAGLVLKLAEAFGGACFLSDDSRKFIENWEVESYRKKTSSGGSVGRLDSKIALVTGGAQGFGFGIAEGLVKEGAAVAIADLNPEGARKAADALTSKYGSGKVFALQVNISDESSVEKMIADMAVICGGIDLFVANAGVLKAGPVKTFEKKDWDFVTDINYTGYFLCVKHAARIMALQNAHGGGGWTDIVQINSKSGLAGSNRNAAYSASKFGTIGQTQSFAMELVEDRIKVNSVCPGNFFDGPLWSDPVNGLFVQYLNSKKVPGAKNIQDVKRFYEAKVPMGRGCLPEDVVKAIVYCVTQEYETGQAIPVSGGQVMLN